MSYGWALLGTVIEANYFLQMSNKNSLNAGKSADVDLQFFVRLLALLLVDDLHFLVNVLSWPINYISAQRQIDDWNFLFNELYYPCR